MRLSRFRQIMSVAGFAALLVLPIARTRAQGITVDGRLSPAQTLAGPNYAIGANLGRQVGGNLFHSFGAFGLNRDETATFSGPVSVANVIGRVTGGAQSSIDGTVRSTMPGANLYLINPAGVVFGPTARVDVSGSFHASSADYLRLQDGARFQATNPDASTLTAAPPAAFGFLTPNPRPVTVSGATLGTGPGGTLGLVGGPVTISGGVLQAPAGTVHITSAAGPGEVAVDPRAGPATTVPSFGPVRVEGKSKIAVSDAAGIGSGGSVFIRAGMLDVAASEIDADNHGPGPGGVVSLRGDGAVTIRDGANVHGRALRAGRGADISIGAGSDLSVTANAVIQAETSGASPRGNVSVTAAGNLTIRDGSFISGDTYGMGQGGTVTVRAASIMQDAGYVSSNTHSPGRGGDVSVMATGSLTIRNAGAISDDTYGRGQGGRVTVQAGSLAISRDGKISAGTYSSGAAGHVSVTVPGAMVIDGSEASGLTGIASKAERGSTGNAGPVAVSAGDLTIGNGGNISGITQGPGRGGNVSVTATGSLTIRKAGAISSATLGSTGQGGTVTVRAASIMQDAGSVSSTTSDTGQGGDVSVMATGSLTIRNAGAISGDTYGMGQGGRVTVQAGSLAISRDGKISAGTHYSSGAAGPVSVTVPGAMVIDGSGATDPTGITSQAERGSTGNAGPVAVSAGDLTIGNGGNISGVTAGKGQGGKLMVSAKNLDISPGGQITAGTYSSGDAGNVFVTVPGAIDIDGSGATPRSETGIASRAFLGSTGKAGLVTVSAGSLGIRGGIGSSSGIATDTRGTGDAGTVDVTVTGGALTIDGAGTETGIASRALPESTGKAGTVDVTVTGGALTIDGARTGISTTASKGQGGSITISAPRLILRDGASISTAAQNAKGGDITIGPGELLYLQGGSSITTFAQGGSGGTILFPGLRFVVLGGSSQITTKAGSGADIDFQTALLVQSPDSEIRATGSILSANPPLNLTGNLVVLTSELRAAAAVLQTSCAAQGASPPRASLVVAGRGGLRQNPETTLPALYLANRPVRAGQDPGPETPTPPLHTSITLSTRCG